MKNWSFPTACIALVLNFSSVVMHGATAPSDLAKVTITATDPIAAESGPSTGLLTVQRTGSTVEPLTVFYGTSGSASNSDDYVPLSGSIVIPAGKSSALILITPVDDLIAEEEEIAVVTLTQPVQAIIPAGSTSAPVLYQFGPSRSAAVIIKDNDLGTVTVPTVSLQATDPNAGESGNPGKITVVRLGSAEEALIVQYEVVTDPVLSEPLLDLRPEVAFAPGTLPATSGVDYQPLAGSAIIPAGAKSTTITIQPLNDAVPELSEHVTLKLKPSSAYNINRPDTATVIITDDDAVVRLATVSIKASQPQALESDSAHPGKFTVTRTGDLLTRLNVYYRVTGTARNGVDYNKLPGSVTIEAGQSSAVIDIVPVPDEALEGKETVTVTLTTPLIVFIGDFRLLAGEFYLIGSPRTATVIIYEQLPNQAPKVGLANPKDGAVFEAGSTIKLVAEAADADGEIVEVSFFANEKSIGSTKESPYAVSWDNIPPGRYVVLAKAIDDRGAAGASSPIRITVNPVTAGTRLIPPGATWKYLDKGSDETTAWRESDFSDFSWASGPGQLGYGDGDEATRVGFGPDPENKFITTYFRHIFNVENPPSFTNLLVRLLRDDGAVVYLNGREILRSNMPDGAIVSGTLASTTVGDEAESKSHAAKVDPKLLVRGGNLLAVEVHQANASSSDLSFDLELIANTDLAATDPPTQASLVIASPTEGATFVGPTDVVITATAVDPNGYISRVEFFANDQRIGVSEIVFVRAPEPGTPIHHRLDWKSVAAGTYTLRAKAKVSTGATIESPAVRIVVLTSGISPGEQAVSNRSALRLEGEIGRRYSIQASSDLIHWREVGAVENTEGEMALDGPAASEVTHQFYRAIPIE